MLQDYNLLDDESLEMLPNGTYLVVHDGPDARLELKERDVVGGFELYPTVERWRDS